MRKQVHLPIILCLSLTGLRDLYRFGKGMCYAARRQQSY